MAKIIITLILIFLISCGEKESNTDINIRTFYREKISLNFRLDDGIEFSFPENTIKNKSISNEIDTILLTKNEQEQIIGLYYNSVANNTYGEKAISGNYITMPRLIDQLHVIKKGKETAIFFIVLCNKKYYGTNKNDLGLFKLRDFIYQTLERKKAYLKWLNITKIEREKIPEKYRIIE